MRCEVCFNIVLIVLIVMTILRQVFKANAIYWRLSSCARWSINSFSIMWETRKPFHPSWCVVLRCVVCVVLCCAVLYCVALRCFVLCCSVVLCCSAVLRCYVKLWLWCERVPMPAPKEKKDPTFIPLSDRRMHDTKHQITVAQKCSSPSLSHACRFILFSTAWRKKKTRPSSLNKKSL